MKKLGKIVINVIKNKEVRWWIEFILALILLGIANYLIYQH